MTFSIFAILFGLVFSVCPCAGQISPPPEGDTIYALPGQNVTMAWKVDAGLSLVSVSWTFLSQNGSFAEIGLSITKTPEYSPGPFTIQRPSTLILENVNMQYNGTYRFKILLAGGQSHSSDVTLIIPAKPSVNIVNCSHPNIISEGSNYTSVCNRTRPGNPPASVTWYKDGVPIGSTSYGENLLTLTNVNKRQNGTYMCIARSNNLTDEKSCELFVHYKPLNTNIEVPKVANIGKEITITCKSEGFPPPTLTITHNGTVKIVSDKSPAVYTTKEARFIDAGIYKCIAKNELGNDTDSGNLTVEGAILPTPTTSSSTSSQFVSSIVPDVTTPGSDKQGTNIPLIIGIIIGVLALIIIVGIVLYYYKSKQNKRGGNRGNIDPAAGNHYELENEDAGPADNAYDSVGPVGTSSGKSKPPEKKNTLPPVYAAVDKNNRQGNTLYASLDTDAMKPKRESKKEPERTPQTEYASIDFAKRADDVPKADLV